MAKRILRLPFGRGELKPERYDMSARPTRKVTGAAAGGGLGIIVAWALGAFAGVDVPGEVGGAISTVLSFVGGYFARDA